MRLPTLLMSAFIAMPAMAHGVSDAQIRCDAAIDARTVAMKAAERVVSHIAAKSGQTPSAEMQAVRALALATQLEAMEMVELRCKGRQRR